MRPTIWTCMSLGVAVLLAAVGAWGAESEPALRLADVVEAARHDNPAIQAARARAHAAAAVPGRVSAYDDPTLSYEAWNAPDPARLDRADNTIVRLGQRIPFPGKLRLAGAVAARDADVAGRDADAVELDVVAAVTAAYYDLWRAQQTLGVYTREKALVDRFARITTERYGVGEGSQPDVLRAQVEVTRNVERVGMQALAVDAAGAELNALLSRVPDAPLGTPEDPPRRRLPDSPSAWSALALTHRPELAAQGAAVAREQTAVALARRSYLPDFEVAASRFINFRGGDGIGAFASVTIPLAFRSKYDAAVTEANARLAAAEAERRRLEDRVRREVAQAFVRARAALLQHDLFVGTHIPQAEQTLRVTESGYRAGTVDFLTLVDTTRMLESAHLEHYEAAAALEKAWADLERAVGTPLADGGAS